MLDQAMLHQKKIAGSFYAAACGNAMASATALKTTQQIKETFGGYVRDFYIPPEDTFAYGQDAGNVGGDFYHPYLLAKALLKNNGHIDEKLGQEVLLNWANDKDRMKRFSDHTIRNLIAFWREGTKPRLHKLFFSDYAVPSTNVAAYNVFPVAFLYPGNIEKSIESALTITKSLYNDIYCLSGAAAVAAAVSCSMKGKSSLYEVVQAGIYGAEEGEKLARSMPDVRLYPGLSVKKRLRLALTMVLKRGPKEKIFSELADLIGSGHAIGETVPMAFALLAANQGDTMESIYSAVNIGHETAPVATIVGAIAGALNGLSSVDSMCRLVLDKKNNLQLLALCEDLAKLVCIMGE
jgi:ADP-ribosylglycohydrolase